MYVCVLYIHNDLWGYAATVLTKGIYLYITISRGQRQRDTSEVGKKIYYDSETEYYILGISANSVGEFGGKYLTSMAAS